MEAQMNKPGPNGTPGAGFSISPGPGFGAVAPPVTSPTQTLGIVLRALAIALTLVATIIMGIAKQTVILDVYDTDGALIETLNVPLKSAQYSALVYFIAANVIVFVYSSITMALSVGRRAALRSSPVIPICDVLMVALLFSCCGATGAIAQLAKHGNSKAGWGQFCSAYGGFCGRVVAALSMSMIAGLAYVKLLIFSIIDLHKGHHSLN